MAMGPPDRGEDSKRQVQPLNMVRGGGICNPQEKGGHLLKGSGEPGICMPTPGLDPRPRWRQAGKIGKPSRHSVQSKQHR